MTYEEFKQAWIWALQESGMFARVKAALNAWMEVMDHLHPV